MTRKGKFLMRTIWPIGSCPSNRAFATVEPRTQTFAAARTSESPKNVPFSTFQERTKRPLDADALDARAPVEAAGDDLRGAARGRARRRRPRGTPPSPRPTSSSVSVDLPVKIRAPDCVATPGKIMRKFVPRAEIWAWIAACDPLPTPIIAITQATPMMMPSAVRIERILLRPIAFSPTFRIVRNFNIGYIRHLRAPRRARHRRDPPRSCRRGRPRRAWRARRCPARG